MNTVRKELGKNIMPTYHCKCGQVVASPAISMISKAIGLHYFNHCPYCGKAQDIKMISEHY